MEVDFDRDFHSNRMTVFHSRFKLPVLHCLHGLFVEAHTKAAEHANICGSAIDSDDQAERADALIFGFAGFFGKFRFGRENLPWRRNAATDMENSAAGAAAFAWAKAGTVPGPYATAAAGSDAAAGTRAVGGQYRACHGVAEIRHVIRSELYLRRNDD